MSPSGIIRARNAARRRSLVRHPAGRILILLGFLAVLVPCVAHAQALQLKPTPKTIAWGYYDAKTPPVLRIRSGDTVEIQTLITSSPERLEGAGVPADRVEQSLRDIYKEVKDKGPGGHILTGPIYIESAEPGDVLEVRIQKIRLAIPYAYNGFGPGRGFLPDDFPYARMKIIPLDETRMVAHFAEASRSRCIPSSAAWAVLRRKVRGVSAAIRRGYT